MTGAQTRWISKSAALSTPPPPKKSGVIKAGLHLCVTGAARFSCRSTQSSPYLHFLGFHRSGESAETARVPQLNLGDAGCPSHGSHTSRLNVRRITAGRAAEKRPAAAGEAPESFHRAAASEGRAGEPARGGREAKSPLFMELLTAQSTQAASAPLLFFFFPPEARNDAADSFTKINERQVHASLVAERED